MRNSTKMPTTSAPRSGLLQDALRSARDTKVLRIGENALSEVPEVFRSQFPGARAIVVADPRTFAAAGREVVRALQSAQLEHDQPYLLEAPDLYAEFKFVEELDHVLAATDAVPIAVGSGSINDLTKLASHRAERSYMSVPTAASMDGYTAYGASITYKHSKQTFDCPAPRAVVADLSVICAAPPEMNASGYADLLAKVTAGADWILADALGEAAIDPFSWEMVQEPLRYWLADPAGVKAGDANAISRLLEGLMMGGFAMQHHLTSRPASGAEHQFSHLWDMQHHLHGGKVPSHGFKVAVGTLASAAMYEQLYALQLDQLDVRRAVASWPPFENVKDQILESFGPGELADKAIEETGLKHPGPEKLAAQLERLKTVWPQLRERLQQHLPLRAEIAEMLHVVGAPDTSPAIGISTERLRESFTQAYYIRRRFTVLDVAMRCGVFDACVGKIDLSSRPDSAR
jgi:glycerol-1-phosphate dehydrogenase [NAD(P)+]